jgi:hypothetical protein
VVHGTNTYLELPRKTVLVYIVSLIGRVERSVVPAAPELSGAAE